MKQRRKDMIGIAVAAAVTVGAVGLSIKPGTLYPDPSLTPGVVDPAATKEKVCTPGYTATVRHVTEEEKRAVMAAYHLPAVRGKYEIDHFISLELGGSNDVRNLWPEPYEPRPGAHEKDEVENYLHREVCAGRITLDQAQGLIRTDWFKVYRQHWQPTEQ